MKKMLSYSVPPGYRRTKPVRRPKLDGFTGIVDAILEADTDPDVPRKQRHTAQRIFERLRDEHGFTGGYTIVKNYVRSRRQSMREAFVPLQHPPGHAQLDFGEAVIAPPRPSSHHRFKQGDFIGRQIEQVIDDPVHFSLASCDLADMRAISARSRVIQSSQSERSVRGISALNTFFTSARKAAKSGRVHHS